MEIIDDKKENVTLLRLNGRIDTVNAGSFEKKIVGLLDGGEKNLLIDFTRCDFINSTGLRVLLFAAKKVQPVRGIVAICCLNPYLKEVFSISGLTALFHISDSESDALQRITA